MAPKLNQGNYAIVRTDVVIGVGIQKKESEAERSDSFFVGLCGKRLTRSAEFGILEKIASFLKGKSRGTWKKRKKNERKRARNDFEKVRASRGS